MLKRIMAVALALVLFGACALAEGAVLTVKGEGVVSLNSDTATITLGIRKFAHEVKTAQQAVNRNMDAVIDALTGAGVTKEDIYTSSISIYPEYNYDNDDDEADSEGSNRIKGYDASNSITILTRDIESVGTLIDIAFDAGANTLDDVSFSASDTTEAMKEALRRAIADARDKAEAMAEAAGVTLGGVISMTEGDGYGYTTPVLLAKNAAYAEDSDVSTRVMASKQSVSTTVTVQFELIDK